MPDNLAVVDLLEFLPFYLPVSDLLLRCYYNMFDTCRSQKQQTVLATSDAALVKQCKDILSRSAAGTGAAPAEQAEPQPSDNKHDVLPVQPQVACLDIMDAETQLVEVSPRATLKYEAAHQPELAHCPADHTASQQDMGFTLPAKESAPAESADMHDSMAQPEARGELPTSSMAPGSAADSQLAGASAANNNMKQPPVSTSATVVQPDPLASAAPASTQGGSGMNALLEAMLTGELA